MRFGLRIVLPTLLAIGLFVVAIFAIIVPAYERQILDRKREMIRELTHSAVSILAEYEREERAGTLTREQAQREAITRLRFLRYGEDGKDYFWVTDTQPRMVMHPYRPDLEGADLSRVRRSRRASASSWRWCGPGEARRRRVTWSTSGSGRTIPTASCPSSRTSGPSRLGAGSWAPGSTWRMSATRSPG